jgi:hypothetical protein
MSRPKLTALADLMPPKGEATRPETAVEFSENQNYKHVSEHSSKQASKQPATQAILDVQNQLRVDHSLEYQDGPRSAVSFRMTERLQDRLREYAHQARRKKQDILDQALHEFLRREGY